MKSRFSLFWFSFCFVPSCRPYRPEDRGSTSWAARHLFWLYRPEDRGSTSWAARYLLRLYRPEDRGSTTLGRPESGVSGVPTSTWQHCWRQLLWYWPGWGCVSYPLCHCGQCEAVCTRFFVSILPCPFPLPRPHSFHHHCLDCYGQQLAKRF